MPSGSPSPVPSSLIRTAADSGTTTTGWAAYHAAKRALDLVLAAALLIVAAPVLLAIALAVRRDSPGPALFRQQRIGRHGRPFMVYKFRTMTVDSPTFGPKPASFDDDRVTRLGRLLRRTSLDELPQLLNVLRGEMSLVGPRPEQPFLVERYQEWHRERLSVLPGMTGWWQVSGRKQPMHDHVEEDLYYVRHCSLRLDLWIMVRTVGAVLRANGAV
ncbi:MAG: sugar transferase [Candidatus Latescibacterota bacterium]